MRRLLAVVAAVAASGVMAAQQAPVAQPPVFRAASDLVTLDVVVTVDGTPVGALGADVFVVTDNGVRQTIESIDVTEVPAEVTIIMDINYMMVDTINDFVDDIARIVRFVRPIDRVRVMTIDTYVRDLVTLKAPDGFPPIERLSTNDLASAHDALAAALMRHHATDRRHLIVAVTNGVDTSSVFDMQMLEAIAKRASATLHIVTADLFNESQEQIGQAPRYSTRWERRPSAGILSRIWRPHHDRAFAQQAAVARATGGSWTIPGLLSDQNASVIFRRFYERSQRAYRIRYVPAGVARDGWHDVTVTIPSHPQYEVTTRPGYSVERPATPAASSPTALSPAAAVTAAYDSTDSSALSRVVAAAPDRARLIRDVMAAPNPWPNRPQREAAFVLDLAFAALTRADREVQEAARDLLMRHSRLVRDPLGPSDFERLWLWAASAMTLAFNESSLTAQLTRHALERFPNEPRLQLIQVVLADRRYPDSLVSVNRAVQLDRPIGATSLGLVLPRVTTTPVAPERHVNDLLAAYDVLIALPETAAEARVRKAWVLHRLERHEEALTLLGQPGNAADEAVEYLRRLFRGRALDALGRSDEARNAYRDGFALAPQAQSVRVALMRHAAMAGDMAEAATFADAVQTSQTGDPWWSYWQADFRFFSAVIARMKQ